MAKSTSTSFPKAIGIIVAGFFAYNIFRSVGSASAIEWNITGIQGIRLRGVTSIESEVTVSFLNPSSSSYLLNSIYLKLQKAGKTFGTVSQTKNLTIGPQGTTIGKFTFNTNMVDLAQAIYGTLRDGKTSVNALGYIRFANLPEISVNKETTYALPSWLTSLLPKK